MAAIDETERRGGTKTFANRTPTRDVRAGILDDNHGDDRSAAESPCPTGSRMADMLAYSGLEAIRSAEKDDMHLAN